MASPGVRIADTPGAYERVKAHIDAWAAKGGWPKEAGYAYFTATGHLPQTMSEFTTFLNQVVPKYGVSRRDPRTGAIRPIMPGVNPDPRLTSEDRGGFDHRITNAEDSDIERQQYVDPSTGDIWGGSWDPAYNRAHPGGGGDANLMRGSAETFNSQGVDTSSPAYQTANPDGQPFGAPGASSGYVAGAYGGGGDGSGYGGYDAQAAELASLSAFRNRELDQLRLPQFEFTKDYSNRQLAQQDAQFTAQLAQQADEIRRRYGEAAAQRHVQEVLGRGNLALGAYGLASDEATRRMQIGLGGASQAGTEALGRINAGIGAAGQVNQSQLGRGNLLAGLRGSANAFQQMKVAGLVAPNLARALAGEAGVAGFQAPQAESRAAGLADVGLSDQSDADRILMQYAQQGLDPYASPSSRQALAYGQQGLDPYGNSPTIQGALGMAGPNAQYAIPGSATSQIPGLAGNVTAALDQLRQSNYGLVADPGQGVMAAMQALRGDPAYAQVMAAASAGDQNAVQRMRRMEGDAVAKATGLDPARGLALVQGWRAQPGQRTPQEIAQSVQALIPAFYREKEAGVLQQIAGLDPQEAAAAIDEMRRGTGITNQPSSPEQIERILATRLGRQGMAGQTAPGAGRIPPFTAPGASQVSSGVFGRDPGYANAQSFTGMGGVPQDYQWQNEVNRLQPGTPAYAARQQYGAAPGTLQPSSSPMGAAAPMSGAPTPAPSDGFGSFEQGQMARMGVPDPAAVARSYLGASGQNPLKTNVAGFLRLPKSAQQFTLAAHEALGRDPNDVLEQFGKMLPRATGARRGFVAPAAA